MIRHEQRQEDQAQPKSDEVGRCELTDNLDTGHGDLRWLMEEVAVERRPPTDGRSDLFGRRAPCDILDPAGRRERRSRQSDRLVASRPLSRASTEFAGRFKDDPWSDKRVRSMAEYR